MNSKLLSLKSILVIGALLFQINIYAQTVSTFAGSGTHAYANGSGIAASFAIPRDVAVDASSNVYVADYNNHVIRKISSAGFVTTLAGSGTSGSANGTGTAATFNFPWGVCVDGSGNVYVSDNFNHKIRKITSSGVVTTFAGSGVAGSANGTGTAASFTNPNGICVDGSGNVYVAEGGNHRIRKITAAGVVTTFAGSGAQGSAEGTGTAASFNVPIAVTIDGSGNVYVADQTNHKIRKITSLGVVSTLAGSGSQGSANGTGIAASFKSPKGVSVDGSGNIYVSDGGNHKVRHITSSGVVTTLAGSGTAGSVNGTGTAASFNSPAGLVYGFGDVYVADAGNHKIRKIIPAPEINVKAGVTNIASAGSFDFGSLVSGTSGSPVTFTIENLGNLNLTISGTPKIVISGANAIDFIIDQTAVTSPIAASGSNTFTITFSPSGTGARNAAITIANNDSDEGTYTINLTGTGTSTPQPEINVKEGTTSIASFGSYNFGSSNVGTPTAATTFTIENIGAANLTLSGTPKIIISSGINFTVNQTGTTSPVAAGGTTSFTVIFNPSTSGAKNDTIRITNNDSDESTYFIMLNGIGTISTPEINVKEGTTSIATSGSYTFPSSNVGTATAPLAFTIENSGTGTLSLSGTPKIAISDTFDFTIDQTTVSSTITAGGSTTFTVSFKPYASGGRQSDITITSNDSDEGTYLIRMYGTGIDTTPAVSGMYIVGNKFVLPNTLEPYKVEIPNPSSYTYIWTYSGSNYFFYPTSTDLTVGLFFTDSATIGKLRCTAYSGGSVFAFEEIDITINTDPTDAYQLATLQCEVEITDCSVGYIDNFIFNSINNVATGCSDNGYTDYTRSNFADTLAAGGVYSANLLVPNTNGSVNYVSMWVDYDNDGDFTGSDEYVAEGFGSSSEISLTNIVFKNKEKYDGPKRLRVRSRPDVPFTAAESCPVAGELGETEDYLIVMNAQEVLEAPQIITPNGDGKNDYFVIRGIKPATENKLTVFDRVGAVKYTSSNYENNWNGTSEEGDKLNPGTYYFVFTNNNNSIKGFLEVRY